MYYSTVLTLRLPQKTIETLDEIRQGIPRSTYIRAVLDNHLAAIEEEIVEETNNGRSTSGRTAPRRPRSPDNPFVVVTDQDRHLHHYKKGDILRYHQGAPIHAYECECGATKEDT